MPHLRKHFPDTMIGPTALAAALSAFANERGSTAVDRRRLRIERSNETWRLTHVDDFIQEYAKGADRAELHEQAGKWRFSFATANGSSTLTLRLKTASALRNVVQPLDAQAPPRPFRVFIGHGRSAQWHLLANHLRDQHNIHVVSYESLAHYGQPASQVLDLASRLMSVALLVHTAELEATDGSRHAVPNVIHETGLFSGRLGADRALVIREDSCRPFTNIAGLTVLRFADNNIREVFGDVVAALRQIEQRMP